MTDTEKLEIAIQLLAEWCVAIDENGASWDYWDDHYKHVMYGKGPLREELDKAIAEARKIDW